MRTRQRAVAVIAAVALVLTLLPVGAIAKVKPGGSIRPLATTYAPDTYEAAGDDTPALARDLTSLIGDYDSPYAEQHSIDLVDATNADVDWLKFTVSDDDVNLEQSSYLFKTVSMTYQLDTVIEIYGPHPTSAFMYHLAVESEGGDSEAIASNDDDPWNSSSLDSALVFRPTTAGTYWVRIRPYAMTDVTSAFESQAGPYTLQVKRGILNRIAGPTRIETAIEVSKSLFESAELGPVTEERCVVIANAYNYPDALGGASLAGIGNGPLLLTSPTSLSAGVGNEIKRLGAKTVYIVGGEPAVSTTVFNQIKALDPALEVFRVAGTDRIKTAAEIAYRAQADAPAFGEDVPKVAIIAYAFNYPDALAATPLAASQNVPILLTGSTTLAAPTNEALTLLGTTDVILMGSTAVISSSIESYLTTKLGAGHVIRMSGSSRYETAKLFASWASDLTGPAPIGDDQIGTPADSALLWALNPLSFGIASGATYADALPGGVACGLTFHPLLLTSPNWPYGYLMSEHDGALPAGDTDWVGDVFAQYTDPFDVGVIFGGPAAISHEAAAVLDNNLMLVNAP
jgi:putative cell wall-binding protein